MFFVNNFTMITLSNSFWVTDHVVVRFVCFALFYCLTHLSDGNTQSCLTALCLTQVSRYQKGRTNLDFTEARDSEWQWHQLGRMQVCTSLQTENHTSTSPLSFLQALPATQLTVSKHWRLMLILLIISTTNSSNQCDFASLMYMSDICTGLDRAWSNRFTYQDHRHRWLQTVPSTKCLRLAELWWALLQAPHELALYTIPSNRHDRAFTTGKKVKVAHTRLPSVGFWSWSRFLAVNLQVTWVKPGGRLPLLSARPAVTPATLKRAATNFAAWWTEAR